MRLAAWATVAIATVAVVAGMGARAEASSSRVYGAWVVPMQEGAETWVTRTSGAVTESVAAVANVSVGSSTAVAFAPACAGGRALGGGVDRVWVYGNGGVSKASGGTAATMLAVRADVVVATGEADVAAPVLLRPLTPDLAGCPIASIFTHAAFAPMLVGVTWVTYPAPDDGGTYVAVVVLRIDPASGAMDVVAKIPLAELVGSGAEPVSRRRPAVRTLDDVTYGCYGVLGWSAWLDRNGTGVVMSDPWAPEYVMIVDVVSGNETDVDISAARMAVVYLWAYDETDGTLVVYGQQGGEANARLYRISLDVVDVTPLGAFPAAAALPGFGFAAGSLQAANGTVSVQLMTAAGPGSSATYWLTCAAGVVDCTTIALPAADLWALTVVG